jgi:hypothetical protein
MLIAEICITDTIEFWIKLLCIWRKALNCQQVSRQIIFTCYCKVLIRVNNCPEWKISLVFIINFQIIGDKGTKHHMRKKCAAISCSVRRGEGRVLFRFPKDVNRL